MNYENMWMRYACDAIACAFRTSDAHFMLQHTRIMHGADTAIAMCGNPNCMRVFTADDVDMMRTHACSASRESRDHPRGPWGYARVTDLAYIQLLGLTSRLLNEPKERVDDDSDDDTISSASSYVSSSSISSLSDSESD